MKTFFKLFVFITFLFLSSSALLAQYNWTEYENNPLAIHGTIASWDWSVNIPAVIFNSDLNRFEMWYTSFSGSYPNDGIGFAYSSDGINWTKNPSAVLTPGTTGWDSLFVGAACVLKEGGIYKMWYTGWKSTTRFPHSIGYATSPDGINWTKHQGNPALSPLIGWESGAVGYPSVIKMGSSYVMFYTGEVSLGVALTGRAISSHGITWERYSNNPVLLAGGTGEWDRNNYLGKVIELEDTLYIYYTGESSPGVSGSAIGMASSIDTGKTWIKYTNNPIITRINWNSGWIETGSVLFSQDKLWLYYDGGSTSGGRIGFATTPYIPVPVELISFNAQADNQKVILKWTTATELNNNGFEIQRRVAESEFATIGFVRGEGTTTNQKEYSYVDKELNDGKYYYRLKQVDYNGTYEYSDAIEVEVRSLNEYTLEQNYPNPFNPTTTIGYVLKDKSNVKLMLLNAIGEEVTVLINEEQNKGFHKVEFNASTLPSGVYFYQLKAGEFIQTRKMLLLK
jgi:predicted GH43/DUF377 family glycosyl hydrolase